MLKKKSTVHTVHHSPINGYLETRLNHHDIKRNFKFLKHQMEPDILVDYLVEHNILNTDENSTLIGKPRAMKCDFILRKLLEHPRHMKELTTMIRSDPHEECFHCFLSLPRLNASFIENPQTVAKVTNSANLERILNHNKDGLLSEIRTRISNESDCIVDDFLAEDVLSVDDHIEISAEINKSKAALLLLSRIKRTLPESYLKLLTVLKSHNLTDLADHLLREIDNNDFQQAENDEELKVDFTGGEMHCSMTAPEMEVRKIKMIITCDDGNERILEKVIKEIPKSEEMFAGETHITFDKISLGSIIIILQTESPYTKERLKYFIEKEGISTFLKHLFKARDIRKILTREKYTIEVKISEAQDETEQITDVLKSAKTSVITYRSRLERCHSFLMEELEPRCLLKDHKVADIFGPVLEKMNQPNLRTTKVNAFLEYLKNQPEEKIQIVLEKLREKNKYIYDQLFPDTTKYQDIDIEQIKGTIFDSLSVLLDITSIRAIQTPFLSAGIVSLEDIAFIHKSCESDAVLQFLKLVLHRGAEAIRIFLLALESSCGESAVKNLLQSRNIQMPSPNEGHQAKINYKAFSAEDGLLFKGKFVLELKTGNMLKTLQRGDSMKKDEKNIASEEERRTKHKISEIKSDYYALIPQFSENHGDNISLERDGSLNCVKAQWKFTKSFGHAFSDFPLRDDRMYEAIFHGSGHASIGLTQTDPDHLSDMQQAVRNNQIILVTDVRFHKRDCRVDIVKKTEDRRAFVFQTKYKDSAPQEKTLMPGADVWIVFYLKFGENMTAEIIDKDTKAALRFHRKVDRNIDLQNERLKVSLLFPVPLAYAVLEHRLEKRHSVRVKTEHINANEKPRLYHIKIGISNSDANVSNNLEFCPNIVTKLEREICIGEFDICLSPEGTFHVRKDNRCIFTKAISSEMNVDLPVYVWFEIFRIRLEAKETMYCTHDSEPIENPRESVRGITPPYAKVTVNELLRTLKGIDKELETGKFTVEVQQTLTEATNEVEKYVNFFSLGSSKADKEVYDEKDGYITPVSKTKSSSSSGRLPIEHEDESPDQPSLRTLQRMLIQIEKTAKAHFFERQTSLDELMIAVETNRAKIEEVQRSFENVSIQQPSPIRFEPGSFQTHLTKNCAQFIQTVEVFPLCDHLLQDGIIHREQYNYIFDEHRRQRIDASRTLFHHLSKKPYTIEDIEKITQAFIETKQEYLLPGWK